MILWEINCDKDGCGHSAIAPAHKDWQARLVFRSMGWRILTTPLAREGRVCFCPGHSDGGDSHIGVKHAASTQYRF